MFGDYIDEDDRAFIEARDMFFLATADADGWPDVSYKGGLPGFVRVTGEREQGSPEPRWSLRDRPDGATV